ncbi:MAG: hypothetical protein ACREHD_28000, partial [Pirellulales bacterium]
MEAVSKLKNKIRDRFTFSRDFLFITLDSLRYDTAAQSMQSGGTPMLRELIGQWQRRETCATYTLPAHVSMFAGSMPRLPRG